MTHVLHAALAVALFRLVNWIGTHAKSSGYISLSVFVKRDEAPAFNFIYRVASPIVFVVISAAILYGLGLDWLVDGIWRVVLYHLAFRLAFNLIWNRALLLNSGREVIVWAASLLLILPLYEHVISKREYLLPDAQSITNELWVIVALFLYSILNSVELKPGDSSKRKSRYLKRSFMRLKARYHDIVEPIAPDPTLESIIYTIMVYESFNRPPAAQLIERLVFPRYSKTLGPMQVTTERRISARESVRLGALRVAASYRKALEHTAEFPNFDATGESPSYQSLWSVAADYNDGDSYAHDIIELNGLIVERFYPELSGEIKR